MSILALDGLPARESGAWTREKLVYIEKYAAAFTTAMTPKREAGLWDRLVYIDLLAGPGVCIDERGEFKGSPLRALGIRRPFDHLFVGDKNAANIKTLERRIAKEDHARVTLLRADCNVAIKEVVSQLSSRTLALAFLDPEGMEVKFETFRALASRRVDIVYLFPSDIGIRRNLTQFVLKSGKAMNEFWGGEDWRTLPRAVRAGGQLPNDEVKDLGMSWVSAFNKKVEALGLKYCDETPIWLRNNQNASMYHLLFFSHDGAGLKIWNAVKRIEASGQRGLRF